MVVDSTYQSTQAAAGGAAPSAVSEGAPLSGKACGIRVTLSAESGQTLSGAGSLLAYFYNPKLDRWCRNPDLDLSLTASHASVRDVTFPDQAVFVPSGRVFYRTSSVTVSGGTNAVITIEVFR